tara:strand:- start:346 stop:747 length:402 start_codon:yes stop_codon:yes gene_type:complete
MKLNSEKNKSFQRNFGYLIAIILLFYFFYSYIQNNLVNYWVLGLFFSTILIAILRPSALKYPALVWYEIGIFLHKIISPIILFLIYFLSIILVGAILKIFKKDPLNKNFNKNKTSYWVDINKKEESINLRNQY